MNNLNEMTHEQLYKQFESIIQDLQTRQEILEYRVGIQMKRLTRLEKRLFTLDGKGGKK